MILGCRPTSVFLAYVLSTGVVLSETSLLLVSHIPMLIDIDILNGDKDLDSVLCFSFEEVV